MWVHTVGLLSLYPMLPTVSVVQSYGEHTGNEVTLTVKVTKDLQRATCVCCDVTLAHPHSQALIT